MALHIPEYHTVLHTLDSSTISLISGLLRRKKTVGMKKMPNADFPECVIKAPAYPIPGSRLFEALGAAVSDSFGYALMNKQLAQLIGQGETTASSWFGGFHHPHLVSWCCLLEQLTPAERQRFINRICRELPLLEHEWIQHDPLTAGVLRNLLAKERGLTLITGSTASRRTFLINAMGRSFTRLATGHPEPTGIDIHQPTRFVPLPNVHYLRNPLSKEQGRKAVLGLWPEVKAAPGRLALFNGIWALLPELRNELLALADSLHVILADEEVQLARTGPLHAPTHRLVVSGISRDPNALAVEIQCL